MTSLQVRPQSSSPHRAARAIRRSPGGRTPSSRRSRPLEPPSSATVTTALGRSVTRRRALRELARPWPPPSATTAGDAEVGSATSLPPEVAVHDRGVDPVPVEAAGELLGHRHRAVLAACAADRERDVALALALVAGPDDVEQVLV